MKKRGIGTGCMWYGIGNTGLPNPASAFVEIHSDATATVLAGCADIGQGAITVMAQIVAEELGLNYEDVFVTTADTGVTPDGGATSASRQTYISGNACRLAAKMAKNTILEVASEVLNVDKEDVCVKNRLIYDIEDKENSIEYVELMKEMKTRGKMAVGSGYYNPNTTTLDPDTMAGIPFETYAYATTIAEVEVDTETGLVDVLRVISSHDVGQSINKQMVEGQIQGGVLMGMGFALLEKAEVSKGKITNPNFSKYLIHTTMDAPEIYPLIVEDPSATGPFGAKGVGEPALIPIIPAIASAIEDAIGIRINKFPITQHDIVEALNQ